MKQFLVVLTLMFVSLFANATKQPDRDPAQVSAFRKTHACPATHKLTGACPGWVVDHKTPLCAGGKDAPSNMHWQAQANSYIKDGKERSYCSCLKTQSRTACGSWTAWQKTH